MTCSVVSHLYREHNGDQFVVLQPDGACINNRRFTRQYVTWYVSEIRDLIGRFKETVDVVGRQIDTSRRVTPGFPPRTPPPLPPIHHPLNRVTDAQWRHRMWLGSAEVCTTKSHRELCSWNRLLNRHLHK